MKPSLVQISMLAKERNLSFLVAAIVNTTELSKAVPPGLFAVRGMCPASRGLWAQPRELRVDVSGVKLTTRNAGLS